MQNRVCTPGYGWVLVALYRGSRVINGVFLSCISFLQASMLRTATKAAWVGTHDMMDRRLVVVFDNCLKSDIDIFVGVVCFVTASIEC